MTSFAGWQMPLRYASETAEHQAVRHAAGIFDLSHMDAGAALDYALTGHLSIVPTGRARYTMICAPDGGVLDDLVAYRRGEQEFLVIANASNTGVVLSSLSERAVGYDATVAAFDLPVCSHAGPVYMSVEPILPGVGTING